MAPKPNKYTPQRVARLVKNPGTRASVPTKYLPAQYRRQRELNQRLDSPVTPGSSLTNRQAARERNATVDQRYGPLESQLGQKLQQSQRVQQAIPQWYDQYRQLLNAAQQGAQQGYAAANQQMQALQAGAGQQLASPQIAAQNAQIASLGGIEDPAQAQIAAQAASQRAAMAGNLGGVIAAQGANQNAYGANLTANTGRHQVESLLAELQNDSNIRGDQAQLGREKGSYAVTTDQGIRDRERKSVLENAAFNLDVANTNADNARADAQLRTTQRRDAANTQRQDETPNQYGYTAKQWRQMTTAQRQQVIRDSRSSGRGNGGGSGGGSSTSPPGVKPATPAARQRANSQIQYALTQARRMKSGKFSRSQAGQTLLTGRPGRDGQPGINKVDQLWASVALDIAYDGHLSRNNQRKLQSLGYSVRDLGLTSYGDYTRQSNRPTSINGRPR